MRLSPVVAWLAPAKQAFSRGWAGSLLNLDPACSDLEFVAIEISMRGQNSPVGIGLQGSRPSVKLRSDALRHLDISMSS